jgi:hypothetical protein
MYVRYVCNLKLLDLRLGIEKRPPDIVGSCEYIKQAAAGSQKGWPSRLGLREVVTTPHRRNLPRYETFHKVSDLD